MNSTKLKSGIVKIDRKSPNHCQKQPANWTCSFMSLMQLLMSSSDFPSCTMPYSVLQNSRI